MSTDPMHIVRIGIAVEMADGSRRMIFSDDPAAEISFETTRNRPEYGWIPGAWVRLMPPERRTEITISGLRGLTYLHFQPSAKDSSVASVINTVKKKLGL